MNGIKRELFPILRNKFYFNTCSIGALSTPVKKAIHDFIDEWNTLGGLAWNDCWTEKVEDARNSFAKIIGSKPKNIAFSFGNSVAVSSVSASFDFSTKNEIIFNELDFPSTPAHFMAKADHGINYIVIKSKDGKTIPMEEYKKAISKKTQLITACEVVSNTGMRLNVDELTEISHAHDIPLLLDTYQSTGCIPMDVQKNDVDFLLSGCLKWLVGGFGISFLYIRDDWIDELKPGSIGWMGVDEPFEDLFDKLRTNLHRPNDAKKFQYGTPYPIGATSADAGMKMVQEIGISTIYEHNLKLTQNLLEYTNDLGLQSLTPLEKKNRGSIVNIQVPNPTQMVKTLQSKGFILDMRSNGIRISPHFYNNSEDIVKFVETLKQEINN